MACFCLKDTGMIYRSVIGRGGCIYGVYLKKPFSGSVVLGSKVTS